MRAEGVVSGSPMWRLGTLRTELLHMIGERLRHVFNSDVQASAGGEKLWASTGLPDTMQLTKIPAQQKLANHWDRRDRWQEARRPSLLCPFFFFFCGHRRRCGLTPLGRGLRRSRGRSCRARRTCEATVGRW